MQKTSIEWCDYSWPIVNGCRRISPGCEHCYAERLAATRLSKTKKYAGLATMKGHGPAWIGETRLWEPDLLAPLRLQKPSRIFVAALGDLFYEGVLDEWIDQVFAVMALAGQHQFQVLTKRAVRMRDYVVRLSRSIAPLEAAARALGYTFKFKFKSLEGRECSGLPWPIPNVWLGVSVENQETADERVPLLLETPAAVRFLSVEPLLEPVNLRSISRRSRPLCIDALSGGWDVPRKSDSYRQEPRVHWVIVGGESGASARPMHPAWARAIRDQCVAAGVPFFFKQWGEWSPKKPDLFVRLSKNHWSHQMVALKADGTHYNPMKPDEIFDSTMLYRVGKKQAGALLDGREWREWPPKAETC